MADAKKTYLVAAGIVQKFPDKPAVAERDVNGQAVRDITIKTVSQKLVRITVWPEFASLVLGEGYFVFAEGEYKASGDNNQFHNVSAFRIGAFPCAVKADREVVNQPEPSEPAAENSGEDSPF